MCAKAKIKGDRIPYEVPERTQLPERLDAVLRVIYLVFNEGYAASAGASLTRHDLSSEAIRLGRLVLELLPDPEAEGLLALMLLHESWRSARISASGDVVLLAEQDRSLWDRALIGEGATLVESALHSRRFGYYTLRAAIAAVHAEAARAEDTDWPQIIGLYDLLLRVESTAIIELNRAVAVAMRDVPAAGLKLIDAIMKRGELTDYHLAHSARADLLPRLGRNDAARRAYERALQRSNLRAAAHRRIVTGGQVLDAGDPYPLPGPHLSPNVGDRAGCRPPMRNYLLAISAVMVGAVLWSRPVRAEKPFPEGKFSMEQCLQVATSQKVGYVVKVEYRLVEGVPIYEFEIVTPDGRAWDVEVSTKTGKVIELEEEVKNAQDPAFKGKAKVSEAEAKKVALTAYSGEVIETEYEIEPDGAASYEFDIKTAKGEIEAEGARRGTRSREL